MDILCILDKDSQTKLSEDLKRKIFKMLEEEGSKIMTVELKKNDLLSCVGCLRCWSQDPFICVRNDMLGALKEKALNQDLIVFFTPVLFGHFSSTIKNTIDRGVVAKVGVRRNYPPQIIIGYGDDIDDEEKSTFIDITTLHTGNEDIVHAELRNIHIEVFVTRSIEDNDIICEKIKNYI